MSRSLPFKLTNLFTWPVKLLGSSTKQLAVAGRHQRLRPTLEALEDRFMPAVRIWDGGATNNNWSSAKNWAGDIAPVSGDDLVFFANAPRKSNDNDFANGTVFNSITLGGGYTLRGNRVRVGAGGILDNSGSSDIVKLDLTVGITGETLNRTFTVGAGSTLFLDGKLDGTLGFIKAGAGNLSLRSNNSYAGQTQVNAGVLFVEKDNSLGALSGGVLVRTGATLLTNDQAIGVLRIDEAITLEAGATLRALNDLELGGSIILQGNATLKHEPSFPNDKLSIIGTISGAGGVTIAAGSRVWYRGTSSNTYQGLTTVLGKLHLNQGGVAIPGPLTIVSGGIVRFEDKSEQINNTAVVTINGTGQLLTNGQEETISRLLMSGGLVSGFDNHLGIFFGFWGKFTVQDELRVTSFSSTLPAELQSVELTAPSNAHTLQVNDGPAFNDLELLGVQFVDGITKEGPGVVFEQSVVGEARTYVINNGLYRFHQEDRSLSFVVNAGGQFAGLGEIGSLTVNANGRVRPGPISSTGILKVHDNLTLNAGAILEVTLNGSNPGSKHDQIDVDGNVFIEGAILKPTLGSGVSTGNQFRIINNSNNDAVAGAFTIPPASAPFLLANPSGQKLSISTAAGTLNNDVVLTLVNTAPMAPDLVLNRTTLNEGGFVTATGHLVDPDGRDQLRLLVNWGDGSEVETYEPGRSTFRLFHQYTDDGFYTPHFQWLDQHGTGNSRSFDVTVNNVAPRVELGDLHISEHHHILFAHGIVTDAGNDFFSVTVDYGDGSPVVTGKIYHHKLFFLNHRYQQAGNYVLTVTATDKDGGVTTSERNVTA
ncbi:MAG TPA: PKD domain-containing protein [Gemmatales bacterium]|nr:PKD domain-containing protein [Gemmatales bacterium]